MQNAATQGRPLSWMVIGLILLVAVVAVGLSIWDRNRRGADVAAPEGAAASSAASSPNLGQHEPKSAYPPRRR